MRDKGFTLIELLVVIAIIALLLAIILPSLKMAKQKTQELVCRINQRGISLGMRLYTEDYDGKVYSKTITNRYMWYEYQGANSGNFLKPDDSRAYWGVAYKDYVDNVKAFGCPSFRRPGSLYPGSMPPELMLEAAFAINRHLAEDFEKVTDIKSPSQFIVCHDHQEPKIENGTADHFHNNDNPNPNAKNVTQYREGGSRRDFYRALFRHSTTSDDPFKTGGNANILWLDGHASALAESWGHDVRVKWYTGI